MLSPFMFKNKNPKNIQSCDVECSPKQIGYDNSYLERQIVELRRRIESLESFLQVGYRQNVYYHEGYGDMNSEKGKPIVKK